MSEVNNGATEQSIEQSIEELGGIPIIEVDLSVSGMTAYPTDKTLSIADMAADAKETGDAIDALQSAAATDHEAIAAIEQWTGENIPVSTTDETTIAEALSGITGDSYPVGSIYMTVSTDAPTFTGTWTEIAITATWTQLKTGKRDYAELESGDTGGTVHFWLRTA